MLQAVTGASTQLNNKFLASGGSKMVLVVTVYYQVGAKFTVRVQETSKTGHGGGGEG